MHGNENELSLTAQQTNLVRSVLQDESGYLNHAHQRHPTTGRKIVMPLAKRESVRFRDVWSARPVGCIRTMNRAIASVKEPERSARYVRAAFDLEVLMDRQAGAADDLVGIPRYLSDGYTDLGFFPSRGRRQRILVDKERLRPQLVPCKSEAVEALASGEASPEKLGSFLREHARALRESVGYTEVGFASRKKDEIVLLSDCVEKRTIASRHLSILFQLRLQEIGISSRLVKGVLRLYGLKGRHAWNVVVQDEAAALVDVTYAEDDGPLVLTGASLAELYKRASELNRLYCPSPDSFNHYEIRRRERD